MSGSAQLDAGKPEFNVGKISNVDKIRAVDNFIIICPDTEKSGNVRVIFLPVPFASGEAKLNLQDSSMFKALFHPGWMDARILTAKWPSFGFDDRTHSEHDCDHE